jgi:nitroreductase
MASSAEFFDIINTTRSMRLLKPDPVPDTLIDRILEAGRCAPNGGNAQRWRFLVVQERSVKQALQVWYKRAVHDVIGHYRSSKPPVGVDPERYRRGLDDIRRCRTCSSPRARSSTSRRPRPQWACRLAYTPTRSSRSAIYGKFWASAARRASRHCLPGSLGQPREGA